MPCASVLLLVINLANRFSDPSSMAMQLPKREVSFDEHSLSVQDVLKHLLSAIASSAQYHQSKIANDRYLSNYITPPGEKLNVIAVATHNDELNKDESFEDKKAILSEILRPMESKCTFFREKVNHRIVMHMIDGRKAEDVQYNDEHIDTIAQKLSTHAYKVEVPLRWYCLVILLREVANKHYGVLTVDFCKYFGRRLDVPANEVVTALKLFHALNMLLFYPDSPVSDLVFVHVESLIGIITELMYAVCEVRMNPRGASPESKQLASAGRLFSKVLLELKAVENLKKAFKDFPIESKIMALFEHLLIAARLPEEDCFFMPALLPVKKILDTFDAVSFLFYFPDSVPMGLLCAVIVQLLSLDGKTSSIDQWRVVRDRDSNFSNFFTLQKGTHRYMLVETLDCIQLRAAKRPDYEVVVAIERAIQSTIEKRKLNIETRRAFYCTECSSAQEVQHVAIIEPGNKNIKCKESDAPFLIDKRRKLWFEETGKKERNLEVHLKMRPDQAELMNLLSADIASKWYLFGGQLKVGSDYLEILQQSREKDKVKLYNVLQQWDNLNENVTWDTILNVVSGPVIDSKKLQAKIEEFLKNKYIDTTVTASDDSSPVQNDVLASAKDTIVSDKEHILETTSADNVSHTSTDGQKPSSTAIDNLTHIDNPNSSQPLTGKKENNLEAHLEKERPDQAELMNLSSDAISQEEFLFGTPLKADDDSSSVQHDVSTVKQEQGSHSSITRTSSGGDMTHTDGKPSDTAISSLMPSLSQPLTDRDLKNCSHHIDAGLFYELCDNLNIDENILEHIKKTRRTTQAQAFALLKEWKKNNPQCTKHQLREILVELDMTEVADSFKP